MPDFTFAGFGDHVYPESRDAKGLPIGLVEPGEIRDLNEPLDHMWRETTDEDRAARAAVLAGREQAEQDADSGEDTGSLDGSTQQAASKPASRRKAGSGQSPQGAGSGSDEAGDSGSKES